MLRFEADRAGHAATAGLARRGRVTGEESQHVERRIGADARRLVAVTWSRMSSSRKARAACNSSPPA